MKLLEQLVATPGIPSREHRVRSLIQKQIKGLFDKTSVDAMGNLICVRKPRPAKDAGKRKSPLKVMIAAHMDQIGFVVRHIDDKGFIRIVPTGGFDTRNLFARMCIICPDVNDPRKDILGVLNPAGRPIHLATEEEKKKIPDIQEFTIDLGIPGDKVKQKVKVGDMVVLQSALQHVGDTVVSQCLDNRIACWIAIEAMKKLKHHHCEIHCVFTVQEEVGLRGALTSAYTVKPDIGIAVDTTLCVDTPGVPEEQRTTKQGDGAALTVMDSASIADLDVFEAFESLAVKKKIPHQRSILMRGGTDAAALQRAAGGCKTMTLSCPTRYIHTVTEMIHQTDMHACRDLLAAYLAQAK